MQLEDISCPLNNAQVKCTHFSNTSCWISQSLTYSVDSCLQHWDLGNKSLISYFFGVLSLSTFKVCVEKQCQHISIINLFRMQGIFFIYCAVRSTKVILAVLYKPLPNKFSGSIYHNILRILYRQLFKYSPSISVLPHVFYLGCS